MRNKTVRVRGWVGSMYVPDGLFYIGGAWTSLPVGDNKVASMNPPCLYMAFFQIHTTADGSVNLVASPIFGVALSLVAFF